MNILVTGGAGFIGSHIADAYINQGHRVVVLDNLSSGKKENLNPKAVFYPVNLTAPDLEDLFRKEKIDIINHHAAQISVTQSVSDPAFDAEINILGSLKLLKLAAQYKVNKVIFACTGGALYGEQDYFPADEKHPCRPLSPYGIAKMTVEHYLDFYQRTAGLNFVSLRYSNVFGPRQDPHGEAGVVAIFCQKLLRDEVPIIYGDGEQTRDFLCVFDVVQANVLALSDNCSGRFNIGTGEETSVNTLAQHLTRLAGKEFSPRYAPPRPGEQQRSVIDASLFRNTMQWQPDYTLERGLQETLEFFRG